MFLFSSLFVPILIVAGSCQFAEGIYCYKCSYSENSDSAESQECLDYLGDHLLVRVDELSSDPLVIPEGGISASESWRSGFNGTQHGNNNVPVSSHGTTQLTPYCFTITLEVKGEAMLIRDGGLFSDPDLDGRCDGRVPSFLKIPGAESIETCYCSESHCNEGLNSEFDASFVFIGVLLAFFMHYIITIL